MYASCILCSYSSVLFDMASLECWADEVTMTLAAQSFSDLPGAARQNLPDSKHGSVGGQRELKKVEPCAPCINDPDAKAMCAERARPQVAEALRGCTLEAFVLQHPAGKAAADLRASAAQEKGTRGRMAYEQAMQLEEQATGAHQTKQCHALCTVHLQPCVKL